MLCILENHFWCQAYANLARVFTLSLSRGDDMLNYLSSVTLRLSTSGNQLELSAYLFLLSSNQLCHSEFITPKSDCVAWGFKGLSLDWHEFQGYSVIFLGLRKEKSGICRSMRSRSCLVN